MSKSKGYRITLSAEGYEALSQLAEEQKRPIANVIRDALQEYMQRHGRSVAFDVQRGGIYPVEGSDK